jgi:hypothetical protein
MPQNPPSDHEDAHSGGSATGAEEIGEIVVSGPRVEQREISFEHPAPNPNITVDVGYQQWPEPDYWF